MRSVIVRKLHIYDGLALHTIITMYVHLLLKSGQIAVCVNGLSYITLSTPLESKSYLQFQQHNSTASFVIKHLTTPKRLARNVTQEKRKTRSFQPKPHQCYYIYNKFHILPPHNITDSMHPSGNNGVRCPTKNVSLLSPGIKWKVSKNKILYVEYDVVGFMDTLNWIFNANTLKTKAFKQSNV